MSKASCEVIRDLLPLYEDGAVSEDTAQLVREHLKDCPACREELRKMRTPISLPLEEDEEAVRRYLERQAEIRKKQNGKIIRAVSVLAVILMFCLWYTRPVSAEQVMGGMPVDNLSGVLTAATFQDGQPGFDTWVISNGIGEAAYQEIMDVFGHAAFHSHLRNLLGDWYSNGSLGWSGTETVSMIFTDGKDRSVSFTLDERTLIVNRSWDSRGFRYRLSDSKTLSDLASVFRQYGEFRE